MSEMIELRSIKLDGGTQSRVKLDYETVKEYITAMAEGAKFPPLVLFYDGQNHWLADGFHRYEAIKTRSWVENPKIEVEVHQGTLRDAVLFSVGANATHGLRRSNADKRRAVEKLLRDEEWAKWSDREIAKRCGVSHPFVADIRLELYRAGGNDYHLNEQRQGADGKTYTVKHWGADHPMAFWDAVKRLQLDKDTILQILQPGVTMLTDLKMSKPECLQRLDQLAQIRTAVLFPVGKIVKHSTGRFGEVLEANTLTIRVMDFRVGAENRWNMDDSVPSSREAYEASLPPVTTEKDDESEAPETYNGFPAYPTKSTPTDPQEFYEGDIVKSTSGHEGTVMGVVGRVVTVKTVNGNHDYHRASLTLMRRAEAAEQTPVEDESPDLANDRDYLTIAACISRVFEYTDQQTDATSELLQDVRDAMSWLSEVEEQLESELVEVKVAI